LQRRVRYLCLYRVEDRKKDELSFM
jgi:hypothetical protein